MPKRVTSRMETVSSETRRQLVSELNEFTKNTEWISRNYKMLRRKFPEQYIAVYAGNVKYCSPSRDKVLKFLRKERGSEKGVTIHFVTSKPLKFLV